MEQLGRNDPCWCGSGLKYKRCHLDFDETLRIFAARGCEVPSRRLIKTPEQIEGIRESGKRNTAILDEVAARIGPGVSTQEIDDWVAETTAKLGGIPAPLHYQGFPKSVCTSVNEQVCHGIPSESVILREGDIVNVDVSTIFRGYHSDSSRMFCIGRISPEKEKLVRVARECVEEGLRQVKPWGFLGDMGQAVHDHAYKNGCSVVREIGGHGVGLEFHEEPWVSYVSRKGTELLMAPGLVFTIEPMVNLGGHRVQVSREDGWTVTTADGKPSAQWEVTVLVTEDGHEILAR